MAPLTRLDLTLCHTVLTETVHNIRHRIVKLPNRLQIVGPQSKPKDANSGKDRQSVTCLPHNRHFRSSVSCCIYRTADHCARRKKPRLPAVKAPPGGDQEGTRLNATGRRASEPGTYSIHPHPGRKTARAGGVAVEPGVLRAIPGPPAVPACQIGANLHCPPSQAASGSCV